MALNPARIGHRYPSYRYEVSREKVREYALVTGVTDPRVLADPADVAAGDVVAPATFAACFTVTRGGAGMFGDTELGAHWTLVHGAQEYVFHRPIRVGDVLECTPSIADITARGRNEFLTLEIECVDASTGEPVVTSRGTIVFLGSAPGGAGVSPASPAGAGVSPASPVAEEAPATAGAGTEA